MESQPELVELKKQFNLEFDKIFGKATKQESLQSNSN
jgi:hypothetical protein